MGSATYTAIMTSEEAPAEEEMGSQLSFNLASSSSRVIFNYA